MPNNIGFCRSCNAKILWVTTASGKKMPLDIESTEDGNVLIPNPATGASARVLSKVEIAEAKAAGRKLFVSHFSSCPEAKKFRKK